MGPTQSTQSAIETTAKKQPSTSVERPPQETTVQRETSRKAMVDNYLEYDALSVDELFEKVRSAQSLLVPLSNGRVSLHPISSVRDRL